MWKGIVGFYVVVRSQMSSLDLSLCAQTIVLSPLLLCVARSS